MVRKLLDKWGLTENMRPQISAELAKLDPNEWWLVDLARELKIDSSTISRWVPKGMDSRSQVARPLQVVGCLGRCGRVRSSQAFVQG